LRYDILLLHQISNQKAFVVSVVTWESSEGQYNFYCRVTCNLPRSVELRSRIASSTQEASTNTSIQVKVQVQIHIFQLQLASTSGALSDVFDHW